MRGVLDGGEGEEEQQQSQQQQSNGGDPAADGPAQSWGLTFEGFEVRLRERNPDTFVRIDDEGDGPVRGASMIFGITFDDETLEGLEVLTEVVDHVTVGLSARWSARGESSVAAVDRVG
ncbi:hypothetical protein [Streptomyces camelliae]|uniref:Uncharacterized protein n=1 Tax=Streptomyces camelliae TaxID=3004093 RepID=A0ABY7NTW7_9ACTN|nr:hypothetical protein [Streptomyces sp. HUAS 2-6]WBO61640.1 hypothetical protein O1G22_01540 [Streptomyces sp. HUAS 2-6]